MTQTIGKYLQHKDLIWVVPCVKGIDYSADQRAGPMTITILDTTKSYTIEVQYHRLKNIAYILLDAPAFRHIKARPILVLQERMILIVPFILHFGINELLRPCADLPSTFTTSMTRPCICSRVLHPVVYTSTMQNSKIYGRCGLLRNLTKYVAHIA